MKKLISLSLALVMTLCMVACGSNGGGGAENVADKVVEAMFVSPDAKVIANLIHDDVMAVGEGTKDEFIVFLDELLDELHSELEGYKITYTRGSVTQHGQDEIDELIEDYEYDIGVTLKITAATTVEYSVTLKGFGEEETETISVTMMQIGGKWYLDIFSMDMF